MPDIEALLSEADPDLGRVVEAVIARSGRQRIGPSRATPFEALARAVVHQGVSGAAAAVAFARLRGAAAGALTPAGILAAPRASLTAAGLSGAKADVIRNLAGWFAANRRIAETLPALRDDEVWTPANLRVSGRD